MTRALLCAAALLLAALRLPAQEPTPRDTTRRDSLPVDSARVDTALVDTAAVDTLRAAADTAVQDTLPLAPTRTLVQPAYRRTPHFGLDPFRYVLVPHWGLILSSGASAQNNAVNASDVGALMFLGREDSLTVETAIDALGLVPQGKGLLGLVQGGATVHLGGPFGRRFGLGFSARAHAYGSFHLDDAAVALLRDGNASRQDFSLGQSRGAGLATAEGGVHAVLRLGATGDQPGLRVIVGLGARYIKPLGYGRGGSAISNGGTIRITGDSIAAHVRAEAQSTPDAPDMTGSGVASDFLLRLELPRRGLALEAMLANVGTVKIQGVERRLATFNVATTRIEEVTDSLDAVEFTVQDTSDVTVTLPRVLRLAVSTWVLPLLQLDAALTTKVTGQFAAPQLFEAGATLRLIRPIPLRVGYVSAGEYGSGLTGGIGIEGRVLYLEISGATLGGSFETARGAAGRVEFGFFF